MPGLVAASDLVARHPEKLHQFLAAWFGTIAFMRQNKAETAERFDRKGLAHLARSLAEMNILPEAPDMSKLYTEQFLPVISR